MKKKTTISLTHARIQRELCHWKIFFPLFVNASAVTVASSLLSVCLLSHTFTSYSSPRLHRLYQESVLGTKRKIKTKI